jgi:3'-5' exoribonuclease
MNNKGIFVSKIRENNRINGIFFVESKKILETKFGKPYLNLTLADSSGSLNGKIWEKAEEVDKLFDNSDYVAVEATAEKYNNSIQLNIKNIEKLSEDKISPDDFMPVTPFNRPELKKELFSFIDKVKTNQFYRKLLEIIFDDETILKDYSNCPASTKGHHHCYIGGLLEHSMSICRLIDALRENYRRLDSELLFTGAILHDIGKIRSYNFSKPSFSTTDEGRLLGHITIGAQIIQEYAKQLDNFDNKSFLNLRHLILSHHGTKEMNAVVLPMMEEAFLLHMMDYLDSTLAYLNKLKDNLKGNERMWTEYQQIYERYFFLNPSMNLNNEILSDNSDNNESGNHGE